MVSKSSDVNETMNLGERLDMEAAVGEYPLRPAQPSGAAYSMSKEADGSPEKRIGKYLITGTLGRGSMGIVYRGYDPEIERHVAIKTLRKLLPSASGGANPALERFKIEARAAGNLRHPHIITIFEANSVDDTPYIVMDLIEGTGLDTILRKDGRIEVPRTLTLLQQIAEGLDYAHERGVIHRDIKPSNILIDANERAYILDFGVASLAQMEQSTGTVLGTPGYMAPEQIRGESLDGRCDIFGLAVVVFECLAGQRPFPGDTFSAAIQNILQGNRHSLIDLRPDLPPPVEAEFEKAFSANREERHQTATELLQSIAHASGTSEHAPTPKSKAVIRQRRISAWRPFSTKPTEDSQEIVTSSSQIQEWSDESAYRIPMHLGRHGIPNPAAAKIETPSMFEELIRKKRTSPMMIASWTLAAVSIVLGIVISLQLREPRTPMPFGETSQPPPSGLLPSDDSLPAPRHAIAPVPEGKSVHEMSDEELRGVFIGSGMPDEVILDALDAAVARRLVGFIDAAPFLFRHDSYVVRVAALRAFARWQDRAVTPYVIPLLDDHDPLVRAQAAKTLAALADAPSLAYLSSRLAKEPEESVRREIQRAMDTIRGFPS